MIQEAEKKALIAQLQREISSLQGVREGKDDKVCLGLGAIEQALPGNIFPVAAVHEFISYGREQAAATNSFITCLLGKLLQNDSYCIWVSMRSNMYASGLKRFGLNADRILFVNAGKSTDALWTIEEALKCNQITTVVGEVPDLSFTESRRLQLAVESSSVTGFIHRCYPRQENTVACVSRWHIYPLPSRMEAGMPGVGFPRWEVTLSKIRNGHPGKWIVEWGGNQFMVTSCSETMADTNLFQSGMYG